MSGKQFEKIIFNDREILVSRDGTLVYPERTYQGESSGVRVIKKAKRIEVSLCSVGYRGRYLGTVVRGKNRKQKVLLAHRAVAIAFIPNPKKYKQVHHINGNQRDNRVENLEWTDNHTNSQEYTNRRPKKGFKRHKTKNGGERYVARMNVYSTAYSLGYFETAKEAQQCYFDTYKEWWGVEPFLKPDLISGIPNQ